MSTTDDRIPTAEQTAQRFHDLHEKLTPSFILYETREAVPWAKVPDADRRLMIATCDVLLDWIDIERTAANLKATR